MLSSKDFPPLPSQVQRKSRPTKKEPPRSEGPPAATRRAHSASLNDLPDELIVEILDYLPGIDLQRFQLLTLASLSLTNRRFHRIVVDRLYSTYDSFFCTPYPFLRTVMCDADIASHVKFVSFKYGPTVHSERPPYVPSISDKQLIKDSLRSLEIPRFDWKQWASDCNDRQVDQELLYATMLLYTPNIARLEIDDGAPVETPGKLPRWLSHFRKIANGVDLGGVHRFQYLKSIRVDVQYLKLRHLAPLFRLRSMRKVTLVGLFEWTSTGETAKEELRRLFPNRSSLIDELQLEMSFVDDDLLNVVISGIKKLKVFRYWSSTDHFEVSGRHSDDYWGISGQQGYEPYGEIAASNSWFSMVKSLKSHTSLLETLSWRDGIHSEDRNYMGALGFLSGFVKLSHLEVPLAVLAQQPQVTTTTVESIVANLPRSVQFLTMNMIHDGRAYYQRCLDYMAWYLSENPTSLREVKVIYHSLLTPPSYNWEKFGNLLLDQGILFEFVHSIPEEEADSEGNWAPYGAGVSSDESDSSGYEESLYSD
ncbi:hypothetical protein P171DRAFT_115223 [Karstenula rhodostoma CBS 690.94]|uniref:F-box domain-containing protein n=1 Tax=Karstenula rhodostoma CBS 690.94 TaxID=1392251 RepID=A0A9P4P7Q6_9PLEO|nr:hypothetical protein P171DRAFT_115223 [Karstenula rhodostoma CBS 690.94]